MKTTDFSGWRCDSCDKGGQIAASLKTHGIELRDALSESHRVSSPECPESNSALYPGIFQEELSGFLDRLKFSVDRVVARADHGLLDPASLDAARKEIVFLDCQLGVDAESLEIGEQIEALRLRLSVAEAQAETRLTLPWIK